MKKVFTATLVLASTMAFAQSAKVVSAYNYNRKGELAQAWTTIEEATKDPVTGVDAKTWKYRFDILMSMVNAQADPNATLENKSVLPVDQIEGKLKESYNKVVELDTKKKFIDDLNAQLELLHNQSYNFGVNGYNWAEQITNFKDTLSRTGYITEGKADAAKVAADLEVLKGWLNKKFPGDANILQRKMILDCLNASDKSALVSCLDGNIKKSYEISSQGFASAYDIYQMRSVTDSVSILNAALTADRAGKSKEALEYLKETMRIKYSGAEPYTMAVRIYKTEGNTTEAINIIKEGRKAFPNDISLLIDELNFYLDSKNYVESERLLKEATAQQPNNETMFFVLGTTYDNLANPKDASGKDLPKPSNYSELVSKALSAYKRTLEIKPDFFDALYNYGALLFNEGAELNNKANELDYRTKQKQIDELNKQAEAKFKEAIPVFEKARTIKPEDIGVLQSLKQLYQRLEMADKFKEVNDKIKSMK